MQELNDEEVELQVPQKFVDLFESAGSNLMSNLDQETPADYRELQASDFSPG